MILPESVPFSGLYKYEYLPLLAKFISDNHLSQFAEEQLLLSRKYNVPLLQYLKHFSDEELIQITKESVSEILKSLIDNNAQAFLKESLKRWLANQLILVGKHDVAAEDITLINHVRGRSLKNFARKFLPESKEQHELINEIDDYLLAANTLAANTYIKILQEKIKDEEDFRSKLSNALPGYIYVFDVQENKELHSNNKLNNILGYTNDEFKEIKKELYKSITHPADWKQIKTFRKNYTVNNGVVNAIETRLKDNTGNYKWIRNYETVLRYDDKKAIKEIIGVAFDVTNEKKITEALATREAQLLEAQSIGQIGSFEWHLAGEKGTTNTPEIFNIFELNDLERFEDFMLHVHQDDVEKVQERLQHAFKTGKYECEYRYLRKGKEKIIWTKGIVEIVNGEPKKMIGTVQDVTTIKRMEAELKHKTEELERSNESLQQFASVASHDLKEPLRKISLFCSKVFNTEKDKISEESKATMEKILESTNRMKRMIEDILQFSFIESNRERQHVSLENLLNEVKDLLSENIADQRAAIHSDQLPKALVNASQIKQLFQNLIANSLKFSRPGVPPVIKIAHAFITDHLSATEERKKLQITLTDNGIGFQEKDVENIFGLFYRLHSRAKFEGSGLGLSICKKIVEQHGGKIIAQSQPNEGATFTIVLPQ